LMPPYLKKAKTLLQKKNAYVRYLNSKCTSGGLENHPVYFGDPCLLAVYHRQDRCAGVFCETINNASLLLGAARSTGKDFGSHIAGDWYLGSRHDRYALRRLALLMDLTYAYGGNWITVESTLFKTNAFSRNDWEDDFCSRARGIMRSFYKFTNQDARKGTPDVPLAAIYGNLESMFWMPDDVIPELIDTGRWDDHVWGTWKRTDYRWVWKALEAWLPPFEFKDLGKDEWLTKMFTGTPYGQVDIVPPYADLKKYKVVTFLGWNTMNRRIYDNLIDYVRNGGTLFICGCHLDTRADLRQKPRIINKGRVKDLIGANIAGKGEPVFEKFHTCALTDITNRQVEPGLFEHHIGRGRVYFFNSYDYPHNPRLVRRIADILTRLGRRVRDASDFAVETGNSGYINYNVWNDARQRKVYLINVDWENTGAKTIMVRLNARTYPVRVKNAGMTVLTIKGDRLEVTSR